MDEHKVRIYVAASSSELDRALSMMDRLRKTGRFEIVSGWADEIKEHGYLPNEGSRNEKRARAEDCRDGLEISDLVWVLMPKDHSMGAFWEFGFAYAYKLATCVSGGNQGASVFTEFAKYRFETDDQAFEFISDITMRQLYSEQD